MEFCQKKESEMFDLAADYYDRYRPSYPLEIIQSLVEYANVTKDSNLLEIGAGSGKATELLEGYGCKIHCVEVGEHLVERGKEKFAKNPNISFECGRFEELKIQEQTYDVIFAAQAFHWILQPIGDELCHRYLRKHGVLAPFWNMYLYDGSKEQQELVALSNRFGGFADFVSEKEVENRKRRIVKEIEASGLFQVEKGVEVHWTHEYSVEEYCGFLQTGNHFLGLSEETKQEAFQEVETLAMKYGGKIRRPYLTVLYLAKRI